MFSQNLREIEEQVGDINHHKLSTKEKEQLNKFLTDRENAARNANKIITTQLEATKKMSPEAKEMLEKQLKSMMSIQGPQIEARESEKDRQPKTKQQQYAQTLQDFAAQYNTPTLNEEKLHKEGEKAQQDLDEITAKREKIEKRKADRAKKNKEREEKRKKQNSTSAKVDNASKLFDGR